jgi:hypothetical protein
LGAFRTDKRFFDVRHRFAMVGGSKGDQRLGISAVGFPGPRLFLLVHVSFGVWFAA